MQDTIKLSNNAEKVSTPGKKQVWRITSRAKGKSEGDYITFADTDVNALEEINMFHPTYTYINKTVDVYKRQSENSPINIADNQTNFTNNRYPFHHIRLLLYL